MVKRVLVTGGTGFLGQHLIRRLRQQGAVVRALVRPHSNIGILAELGVELVTGDVLAPASLETAIQDVTTVFHLAGRLHMPGVTEQEYEQLHVEGTHNLLLACLAHSSLQRIIHCSTTGVIGPTGPTPATEETLPLVGPRTSYERSKAKGEALAVRLAHQQGLPLTVVRPALVYGPGDLHLLGWFRAIQRGIYRVVGSGDNRLHPIYIDDLITGLLCAAEIPAAVGRTYQLVGPEPVPIREIAAAIGQAVGRSLPGWHIPLPLARGLATLLEITPGIAPTALPLTHSRIDFMIEERAYCGARARDELGFVPQVGLETGLRQTVAWYRTEGLL